METHAREPRERHGGPWGRVWYPRRLLDTVHNHLICVRLQNCHGSIQ